MLGDGRVIPVGVQIGAINSLLQLPQMRGLPLFSIVQVWHIAPVRVVEGQYKSLPRVPVQTHSNLAPEPRRQATRAEPCEMRADSQSTRSSRAVFVRPPSQQLPSSLRLP